MSKNIAVVGGGPGGLFFAILMKARRPDWDITVFERNQATDAFGFGVVFSDATLKGIDEADTILSDGLAEYGARWDRIDVRLKGETHSFSGNGMSAIHRKTLLRLLQDKAATVGVDLHFGEFIPTPEALVDEYDLILAADGMNSEFRKYIGEDKLGHTVEQATAKFIWFGTDHMFEGLTFLHRQNEHGNFAVHAYPISEDVSTFIIEADEASWRAAGLDEFDVTQPPGASDEKSKAYMEKLFAEELEGGVLLTNNSRWGNFRGRKTKKWHSGNIVFLGDAVHTAHFSVGSGTKMAMEDAIALAAALDNNPDNLENALLEYESVAQPQVAKVQDSARPSLRWWEHFGTYYNAFDPWQFTFHFFSRSIPLSKIRKRDAVFADKSVAAWTALHGSPVLETPLAIGSASTSGRLLSWSAEGNLVDSSGQKTTVTDVQVIDISDAQRAAVSPNSNLIIVTGGSEEDRIGEAELITLATDTPVAIEIENASEDLAETLVLSGRVDAVLSK